MDKPTLKCTLPYLEILEISDFLFSTILEILEIEVSIIPRILEMRVVGARLLWSGFPGLDYCWNIVPRILGILEV